MAWNKYWVCPRALGVSGGALAFVIPISLAGAGLLFAAVGSTAEEAVVLTALLYFTNLLGALQGGMLEMPVISNRFSISNALSLSTI